MSSCKVQGKQTKETKQMITRDPVTGRFMKARRTQKKAVACKCAKTAKAKVAKTTKKVAAKKTQKKGKKA